MHIYVMRGFLDYVCRVVQANCEAPEPLAAALLCGVLVCGLVLGGGWWFLLWAPYILIVMAYVESSDLRFKGLFAVYTLIVIVCILLR